MTWLQRYRVRHYLRNAVWVWPVVAMVTALIVIRPLHSLEKALGWEAAMNPETARALLGALAGATFTFIVFVCSSLLLVVQLASAQLTPRAIGSLFRDHVTKLTLSVFVFTFTFALAAMIRIGDTVPLLISQIAAYSCLASVGLFLYMIDHIGKLLRPSGVLNSIAAEAHLVIENVYPRRLTDIHDSVVLPTEVAKQLPDATLKSSTGGVVLAFDVQGLVKLATKSNCVIELAPQVGKLVGPGDPLFRIYGSAGPSSEVLYQSIALGAERTVEQDPAFAFRVIVDIASKGLSPAINDPTTAVLAIDRLHHLLRHVGSRRLDNAKVRDAAGQVRLIYRTPDWEDFIKLAVTEIRQFGGSSIQVARRLRAMLEDLVATLPAERTDPLRQELQLLKKSSDRFFQDPEDQALAAISDFQGVGGA